MDLLVVESPTKAKTLSKILGDGFLVLATRGHIKDLPKNKLGIDIEDNFKPTFLPLSSKKVYVDEIKKKALESDKIFLATDPDREGEAIAFNVFEELKDVVGKDKIFRISFHEIVKEAVEQALESPKGIDMFLVNAQIGRRVLDRLVGYKISPLLWKKVRLGLSAGRVQSAALRLIVEREKEIEDFVKEEYWEVFARVKDSFNRKIDLKLIYVDNKKAYIKNEKEAQEILDDLKDADFSVLDFVVREYKKEPPPPFTTSTLTQNASNLFGWSSKKIMNVAQNLYEKGYITYHRTDSFNVSQKAIIFLRTYIEKNFGKEYLSPITRIFKTKSKLAQEAHEAIRPTEVSRSKIGKERKDLQLLYSLIWRRFVATQMASVRMRELNIKVKAVKKGRSYILSSKEAICVFEGWQKIFNGKKNEKKEALFSTKVKVGSTLYCEKVWTEQKFTQPPLRYSEATLVKTLEKLGIGRPSTYAPIISTLFQRQYVEKEEGRFIPTLLGKAVNDYLVKNFPDIVDYSFTAYMEDELDNIAKGKKEWQDIVSDFWKDLEKSLLKAEKGDRVKIETVDTGEICPKCKKGKVVIRIGRFGKFLSCSLFPECDYRKKYERKIGIKCPQCKKGDVIVRKTKKGKLFYGCSLFPNCKWASWKKPEQS